MLHIVLDPALLPQVRGVAAPSDAIVMAAESDESAAATPANSLNLRLVDRNVNRNGNPEIKPVAVARLVELVEREATSVTWR